jgi:nicotinamidase-related amidase
MNVNSSAAALLVIDAQEAFRLGPRWERRNNREFERNTARLITAFRKAKLPIAWFLHIDGDRGFEERSPHFKVMPEVAPHPWETTFVKWTRSCFTSTPLVPWLIERGVRRVVISGIQMEQCCETTARMAADLGFSADFVTEATLTFPITHLDRPGEELGVDAIRERTEYALRGRFARIATVDTIVGELA